MKKYFAATNAYANEVNAGFANTWIVFAFEDSASRDEYVASATDVATRKISKKDIKEYVEAAKPFSGRRRAIDNQGELPSGAIGRVELMWRGEGINL
jgi:hypothetical protein